MIDRKLVYLKSLKEFCEEHKDAYEIAVHGRNPGLIERYTVEQALNQFKNHTVLNYYEHEQGVIDIYLDLELRV